jgi:hypothetical protein
MALLAYAALALLWSDADDDGCCHRCCNTCAALFFLDQRGLLDAILREWPDNAVDDAMFLDDGILDRSWVYRQWNGSKAQEQCGHRVLTELMTCYEQRLPGGDWTLIEERTA